ncbi:acyl-CoA synthetase family member 2, mitochondrial-like [Mizuhopecten yessoensis]|uniref:Acyl-CoA synthetase family member 2, mitochondrial n=1 Tax=Mizuhopecten yessoensis TaxID=6573 RepID=A0A210QRM7_MIZYE|nr:acyl-CoA synthetase family member 2, mitochondrial-like [Mizuhopecten yessoensis]OWF51385.1 Acyl-CoA synthetase family member 2, mitochondrial [Mizuhopecten yessoensis]
MSKWSYLHSPPTVPNVYISLNDAIKKNAETSPNTEAFIYRCADGSRQSIISKDLYEKSRCVAKYLITSGVSRQDKVGIFGPNTLARIVAEFGILLAGGVVLQLNINVKNATDAADMLDKGRCRIVFADPGENDVLFPVISSLENEDNNEKQNHQIILLRKSSSTKIAHTLLSDIQSAENAGTVLPEVYPEDDAIIFTTSGSTGKPKMVVHSHFNFINAFLHDLITEQDNIEDDGFRLQSITTGGQIIDHFCTKVLGRFCRSFSVGYGSTEAMAVTFLPALYPGDHLETGNVGTPFNGVEVRIVDSEGRPTKIGQVGEIQIRSSFLMKEYFADEAITMKAFTDDRHKWFKPEDLGLITSSGDLIIRGRVKDNISRGGRKVLPALVDDVVKHLEGLRLVATVAVPDARLYEEVCVCFIAEEGADLSPSDVQRYCEEKFSKDQSLDGMGSMPKYFVRFDEFPTLFTGKPDKQELRRRAAGRLNLPVR